MVLRNCSMSNFVNPYLSTKFYRLEFMWSTTNYREFWMIFHLNYRNLMVKMRNDRQRKITNLPTLEEQFSPGSASGILVPSVLSIWCKIVKTPFFWEAAIFVQNFPIINKFSNNLASYDLKFNRKVKCWICSQWKTVEKLLQFSHRDQNKLWNYTLWVGFLFCFLKIIILYLD